MIPTSAVSAFNAHRSGRAVAARLAGVTLIELVAALAIGAIVLALGAPPFVRALARHAVAAQAEELQDAVRLGRNEAMKRGGPVVLCRTDALAAGRCAGSGGSWQTWLLFADVDRDGTFNAGDTIVRQHLEASNRMRVASNAASIRFESTGIAHSDNGAAVDFVLTPAGATPGSADGDRGSQRQVCVNPRGEVAVIGGATCP